MIIFHLHLYRIPVSWTAAILLSLAHSCWYFVVCRPDNAVVLRLARGPPVFWCRMRNWNTDSFHILSGSMAFSPSKIWIDFPSSFCCPCFETSENFSNCFFRCFCDTSKVLLFTEFRSHCVFLLVVGSIFPFVYICWNVFNLFQIYSGLHTIYFYHFLLIFSFREKIDIFGLLRQQVSCPLATS